MEIWEDTHGTPLSVPTLAELARLVDTVVEDTVEKALKYTQENEVVNAQKKEVISLYCDTVIVSYYTNTIIVSLYTNTIIVSCNIDTIIVSCSSCFHFLYLYIHCFKISECWGRR